MFDTNCLYLCCCAGCICVIPSSITRTVDSVWYWKKIRYLPIHEIAKSLGHIKYTAIPMFHDFTGCNTVPAFAFVVTKTAWDAWNVFDEITEAFVVVCEHKEHLMNNYL